MKAPKITVHTPQGQQLPSHWQSQAKQRAADAEASYRNRLENAWRGQDQHYSGNLPRDSRLAEWRDIIGER